MVVNLKLISSAIAIVLTFLALFPYIFSILSGSIKPHFFSWVIWGITTIIIFFTQVQAEGGVGAWPVGISGILTMLIAYLAFVKHSNVSISNEDRLFLLAALMSLPVWYLTANPLWAVCILTFIDLLGFGPTIRKAYYSPYDESLPFFMIFVVRNFFVVIALEHYSFTTLLFPLSIIFATAFLVGLMIYRRRTYAKSN